MAQPRIEAFRKTESPPAHVRGGLVNALLLASASLYQIVACYRPRINGFLVSVVLHTANR